MNPTPQYRTFMSFHRAPIWSSAAYDVAQSSTVDVTSAVKRSRGGTEVEITRFRGFRMENARFLGRDTH